MMPIFISSSKLVMTHPAQALACAIDLKFGDSQGRGCVPAHTLDP
jgi:hypothetical protein